MMSHCYQNNLRIRLITMMATRTPINILFCFSNFFIFVCSTLFSSSLSSTASTFPAASLPPSVLLAPTVFICFAVYAKNASLLILTSYDDLEEMIPRIPPSFTKTIL